MKINDYHTIIEGNKFNMKKKLSVLRNIIGKQNDKSNFPPEFVVNDKPVTDKSHIAKSLNNYFSKLDWILLKMCHRLVPKIVILGQTLFPTVCLSTE